MPLFSSGDSAPDKTTFVRTSHEAHTPPTPSSQKAASTLLDTVSVCMRTFCGSDQRRIVQSLALLLCLQGTLAIGIVTWSPRYLFVADSAFRIYFRLVTATYVAGITIVPALLALLQPRRGITRIAIGICQLLMGCLLFFLSGRHILAHVEVAGALALLGSNVYWLVVVVTAGVYAMRSSRHPHKEPQDSSLDGLSDRQKVLAAKLVPALETGVLSLVYQPIFRDDEQMIAVEVLARWHDLHEGTISPAEFIPVAEATGLIVPLSEWVLRVACKQMVEWVAIEPRLERLAVNVSVKHIWRADFVTLIETILKESGLPPHRLELEVTEGALVTDFVTVKRHLTALRRLGVRISIDDFGTGYSSLNRVRELDADTLKVDRCFVQSASETASGVAVVQAIIAMGHSLQLSVIAEGVETQEQMIMLRGMRCDGMQGFLLARPQSAEIITATLYTAAKAIARDTTHPLLSPSIPQTLPVTGNWQA